MSRAVNHISIEKREAAEMSDVTYSIHAERRMRQRGLRERDIALLLAYGTQLDEASIVLSNKDAAREIERRKTEIQALERLRGCQVVLGKKLVITCYHSRPHKLKKKLRHRH